MRPRAPRSIMPARFRAAGYSFEHSSVGPRDGQEGPLAAPSTHRRIADMLRTVMVRVHSIVAAFLVLTAWAADARPAAAQGPAPVGSLQVFMQGRLLGNRAGYGDGNRRWLDHPRHRPPCRPGRSVDDALRDAVRPRVAAGQPRGGRHAARPAAHHAHHLRRRQGHQRHHAGGPAGPESGRRVGRRRRAAEHVLLRVRGAGAAPARRLPCPAN